MRRKWFMGLAALAALTGLVLWLVRTPEPSYQGRSARAWLDLLDQPDIDREQVVAAFKAMGPDAARFLAAELERKPSWIQNRLWELKYNGRLPGWVERRIPDRHDRRRDAAGLLKEFGPDAEPALPVLPRIFREGDQDELVLAHVHGTLVVLGDKLEFMVPELARNLTSHPPRRRVPSAHLLGGIGPKAKAAVPALETAAQEGGWMGEAAAMALLRIDAQTNLAVQILTQTLDHTNPMLRQFALLDLRDLGSAALPAVPRIRQILQDPDNGVREQAAKALTAIDPTALDRSLGQINQDLVNRVDRLVDQVRTAQFAEQMRVVEALVVIGPDASTAVPILMEILGQSRITNLPVPFPDFLREQMALRGLKSAAARALASIGPDARAATSLLIQQLRAHEGSMTTECTLASCRALGGIGHFAAEAVPTLCALLEDRNRNVRIAAARALLRISPATAPTARTTLKQLEKDTGPWIDLRMSEAFTQMHVAVGLCEADRTRPCPAPKLIEVLKQPEPNTPQVLIMKECAAELLGDIGAEAEDAIPGLLDLTKEGTTDGQRVAAIAIRKIDPEAAARLGLPGLLALP